MISGMLLQLSKAKPAKNRHVAKPQNVLTVPVANEATKATALTSTNAGIRPLWSATHPKMKPPTIEPQKNKAWAVDIRYSRLHTQSS